MLYEQLIDNLNTIGVQMIWPETAKTSEYTHVITGELDCCKSTPNWNLEPKSVPLLFTCPTPTPTTPTPTTPTPTTPTTLFR